MEKILVIGLDGATFDLIKPWAEQGHLPVLNRLMQEGASGHLTSTFPPLTGPAWSSFITGKSPARHGVFEFFYRKPGTYTQALHNRLTVQGKSLWNYLGSNGKKVGIMGVPLTYPPEEVNGFAITGLLTPPNTRKFTYPPELLSEIESKVGKYILRQDEKYRPSNPMPFIKEQYDILENNIQSGLYLIQNREWDFMMIHFLGTDRISHEFWHNLDENHPQHNPEERARLGNVILEFYKAVDQGLERILAALEPNTGIIIMSDHGFGKVKKFINLNVWLLKNGYLKLKRNPVTLLRYLLFRLGFNYDKLGRVILKLGFGRQAKQLGRAKREDLQRKIFLSLDDVDWSRTRAYSMGNFGQIYLNMKGREPKGIIQHGLEAEQVLEEISEKLRQLQDPDTGEQVVEKIFGRDEVYHGPLINSAPDLMFFSTGMEYKVMGLSDFSSPRVFEPVFGTTGHHRMEGILIAHAPGIFKEGQWLEGAQIEDLAPTILYLLGQPIPNEMDGKILFDFIRPEFSQGQTPEYFDDSAEEDHQQKPPTQMEEEQLKERLRDLGYVT